jgi:hypothetical protein
MAQSSVRGACGFVLTGKIDFDKGTIESVRADHPSAEKR